MVQLLLAMFLQLLLLLLAQSEPKYKLRMDFIAGVAFVEKASYKLYRDALLLIPNSFDFDKQYTRMGLLEYSDRVLPRISLSDPYDKVVTVLKNIENSPKEDRSYLHQVLPEMRRMSNDAEGRKDALKVFLILTHMPPTVNGTTYDYKEAEQSAKLLQQDGMFFIIFDDHSTLHYIKSIEYLKSLCGPENFTILKLGGVARVLAATVLPRVLDHVCNDRVRLCSFTDAIHRRVCTTGWHFKSVYMDETECRRWRNYTDPLECTVEECYDHCDTYWQWQDDTVSCDCNVGLARRGETPPLPRLYYCPRVKQCQRCSNAIEDRFFATVVTPDDGGLVPGTRSYSTFTNNPPLDEDADGMDVDPPPPTAFPLWAIICLGIGIVLLIALATFIIYKMARKDAKAKVKKKRPFADARRRTPVKRKPARYHKLNRDERYVILDKSRSL